MTDPTQRRAPEPGTTQRPSERWESIDVARGVLLVAMVIVHIVSRHATGAQSSLFHEYVGIFLVSSGFVALSGYVAGGRGVFTASGWLRALENGFHLLLVMASYGVVVSLLEHGLARLAGGAAACRTEFGWAPPVRFESLGILLPIAIVQLIAPLARARSRWMSAGVLALALGWMLLPELARDRPAHGLLGVLVGRTLTPFYTVSMFVAVGTAWSIVGRRRWHAVLERRSSPGTRAAAAVICALLALPAVSTSVLEPIHEVGGTIAGAVATLGYWSLVIGAFVLACTARPGVSRRAVARFFSLFGRNSLLVFVLHAILLELNDFVLTWSSVGRGLEPVIVLSAANVAVLGWVALRVERHRPTRAVARVLLLDRSREGMPRSGPFSPLGLFALATVLAVYTSAVMARANVALVVDDMERRAGCPAWWQFGDLEIDHVADADGSTVMRIRGRAPGMFAHGIGLYMDRDIGERRTLHLDVRGYGPSSGRMKVELLEDDNGNWDIEKDERLFVPTHDDRFVREIRVDWDGWRQLELSTDTFVDDNPGRGNDVFDPHRDMTSGGLLEIQLLFAPASPESDEIQLDIDNIRWLP
jgi:fucose 4-O-acetylase-like acetyltransferase